MTAWRTVQRIIRARFFPLKNIEIACFFSFQSFYLSEVLVLVATLFCIRAHFFTTCSSWVRSMYYVVLCNVQGRHSRVGSSKCGPKNSSNLDIWPIAIMALVHQAYYWSLDWLLSGHIWTSGFLKLWNFVLFIMKKMKTSITRGVGIV